MVLLGSIWMVNPPAGYVPEGYVPPSASTDTKKAVVRDYDWNDMLKKVSFWTIWLIFVFGGMAGLMVIGTIRLFGIDTLQNAGLGEAAARGCRRNSDGMVCNIQRLRKDCMGKGCRPGWPEKRNLFNVAASGTADAFVL